MSLIDLFNPSVLMYLGVLILSISVLVVYFEGKFREQNHKIASMFSIVSTLAEDIGQLKYGTESPVLQGGSEANLESGVRTLSVQEDKSLIEVSDDEDSDNESDSESDTDSDDEEEGLEVSDDEDEKNNIMVSDGVSINDESVNPDTDNDLQFNIKVLKIEESENLNTGFIDFEKIDTEDNEKPEYKKITIDLEDNDNESVVDYKKLPLQKLKSIVTEKELATDVSKLKKNDLLKLLGVE